MAKYPAPTPKVLNSSGHVGMKEQMACAAKPHAHFQENCATGTRSLADTTHGANGGMKNGGPVSAEKLTLEERAESPRERAREERDLKGEAKEGKKK